MDWCKLWSEWAHDPKIQTMPEHMRNRHVTLLCLRCNHDTSKLTEEEIAFYMRIDLEELEKTKELFVRKGFIDKKWNVLKWNKRQDYVSKTAKRMRALRERERNALRNGDVTSDVTSDVTANVTVTSPRGRAEEEESREEENREDPPNPPGGIASETVSIPSPQNPPEAVAKLAARAESRWPAQNADTLVGDLCRDFDVRLVAQILDQDFGANPKKLRIGWVRKGCQNQFNNGWKPEVSANGQPKPGEPEMTLAEAEAEHREFHRKQDAIRWRNLELGQQVKNRPKPVATPEQPRPIVKLTQNEVLAQIERMRKAEGNPSAKDS